MPSNQSPYNTLPHHSVGPGIVSSQVSSIKEMFETDHPIPLVIILSQNAATNPNHGNGILREFGRKSHQHQAMLPCSQWPVARTVTAGSLLHHECMDPPMVCNQSINGTINQSVEEYRSIELRSTIRVGDRCKVPKFESRMTNASKGW
jgi:hypothetical protein